VVVFFPVVESGFSDGYGDGCGVGECVEGLGYGEGRANLALEFHAVINEEYVSVFEILVLGVEQRGE